MTLSVIVLPSSASSTPSACSPSVSSGAPAARSPVPTVSRCSSVSSLPPRGHLRRRSVDLRRPSAAVRDPSHQDLRSHRTQSVTHHTQSDRRAEKGPIIYVLCLLHSWFSLGTSRCWSSPYSRRPVARRAGEPHSPRTADTENIASADTLWPCCQFSPEKYNCFSIKTLNDMCVSLPLT